MAAITAREALRTVARENGWSALHAEQMDRFDRPEGTTLWVYFSAAGTVLYAVGTASLDALSEIVVARASSGKREAVALLLKAAPAAPAEPVSVDAVPGDGSSYRFTEHTVPVTPVGTTDEGEIGAFLLDDSTLGLTDTDYGDYTPLPVVSAMLGEEPLRTMASKHVKTFRYAVDVRPTTPGDCYPAGPELPLVRSLRAALELYRETGDLGTGSTHAWVYAADQWDGISYGDPVGVIELGPRGGSVFTYF